MRFNQIIREKFLLSFLLLLLTSLSWSSESSAGQLQLSWTDNATNEDGFKIERKTGTTGTYAQITTIGANVTSYTDSSLVDGATYCYQVRAYNSAGNSPYTPQVCGAARPTVQTFNLAITKTGSGTGTVTSTDGGINCGSTCSGSFNSGTVVQLNATAAAGSIFTGWTGAGCSSTGSVTIDANKTCAATFNLQPTSTFTLTVIKAGTGGGTISGTGIACPSDCSEAYNSGTVVQLTTTAAVGSIFAGWSGTGCATGSVTMNTSMSCTATFQPAANLLTTRIGAFRPDTGEWFLDYNGNGQWDGCGVDICINSFGQTGDLPVIGSWSGNGTSNIGTFSPATGTWQLDTNGDGVLNCAVDTCFSSFGEPGDLPVTREINGLAGSFIGTYSPQTIVTINGKNRIKRGVWRFDVNANNTFDGCSVDECDMFGTVGELPVVGDWNGTGTEEIGLFLPRYGKWFLDVNGNGSWNGCRREKCLGSFGIKGDLPVVGNWDGTGTMKIGVFRPSTGEWFLDINGNGKLDNCTLDLCVGPFGQAGDFPVVGKW